MSEMNNEKIKKFLLQQTESERALTNYGFLLVTGIKQLNDEALHHIKQDFKEFCESEAIEL
jgi:hypothetical protein